MSIFWSLALLLFSPTVTARRKPSAALRFTATAFSVDGTTAKGNATHAGTAAADPAVIPLGSKVRITDAGAYSGVYTVTDTGRKVGGRTIDIYIADPAEAKAFGRKQVRVEILASGDNIKNLPETAAKVPTGQLAPAVKP